MAPKRFKTHKGIKNPDRANGKAWKHKHGKNPPVEQSAADHKAGRARK